MKPFLSGGVETSDAFDNFLLWTHIVSVDMMMSRQSFVPVFPSSFLPGTTACLLGSLEMQ